MIGDELRGPKDFWVNGIASRPRDFHFERSDQTATT
jgi:hypothetical protein